MILAILQARISSQRFPGKVLKNILGIPMLLLQIERILRAKKIDKLLVATSNESSDDSIKTLCFKNDIPCFRGSLNDVLDRFYQSSLAFKPQHIVRLTADCPLIDPFVIDAVIKLHLRFDYDYTSNFGGLRRTFPHGLDTEIMRASVLKEAWSCARLKDEREHVTPFIYNHPERFKIGFLLNDCDLSSLRITVDYREDFDLVTKIYEHLYPIKKDFLLSDILDFLALYPELKDINLKYR